jgi:hypothetical protein
MCQYGSNGISAARIDSTTGWFPQQLYLLTISQIMSMLHLCKILALTRPFLLHHLSSDMQMRVAFLLTLIVPIMVALQMLVFKKPLKKQISLLLFVQLVRIIKMGLLSSASRN